MNTTLKENVRDIEFGEWFLFSVNEFQKSYHPPNEFKQWSMSKYPKFDPVLTADYDKSLIFYYSERIQEFAEEKKVYLSDCHVIPSDIEAIIEVLND